MVAYLQGPLVPPPELRPLPSRRLPPIFPPPCRPTRNLFPRRRLLDCWVLGNILCKLQVKCENSSDWFNSAMSTKWTDWWAVGGGCLGVWVLGSLSVGIAKNRKNRTKNEAGKVQKQQKISRTGNTEHRILKWQFPKRRTKTDKNKAMKSNLVCWPCWKCTNWY